MYGNIVDILASGVYKSGKHSINIYSKNDEAGTYLYRLVTAAT